VNAVGEIDLGEDSRTSLNKSSGKLVKALQDAPQCGDVSMKKLSGQNADQM
jgi:hypothetical protein